MTKRPRVCGERGWLKEQRIKVLVEEGFDRKELESYSEAKILKIWKTPREKRELNVIEQVREKAESEFLSEKLAENLKGLKELFRD